MLDKYKDKNRVCKLLYLHTLFLLSILDIYARTNSTEQFLNIGGGQ